MLSKPDVYTDPAFIRRSDSEKLSDFGFKKYLYKKIILKLLYQKGQLSNPEICRLTNMSSPSVQKLLRELAADGLVREEGVGPSYGGRKPALFGIKPDARYLLGIKIGQNSSQVAVFNMKNELCSDIHTFARPLQSTIDFINQLSDFSNEIYIKQVSEPEKLLGIGLAIPGLTDPEKGISHSYFRDLDDSVQHLFESRFSRPVFMDNDARVMTVGELEFGAARKKSHVLCLNIGSGIGMGIILDGRLYRGNSGFAGEFGHIKMIEDGELCICGKRGCLETVASGRALEKKARKEISAGKISGIRSMIDTADEITVNTVIKAARQGDQYSIDLLQELGEYLGRGLAILIHVFNPEAIIIGGQLAKADQFIIDPIQQSLNRYTIPQIKSDTLITTSGLGEQAAVWGAMALAMRNIFDDVA